MRILGDRSAGLAAVTILVAGILWLSGTRTPLALSQSSTPPAALDRALRLIGQARKACEQVQDYTCVLVKREQVDGKMPPESVIALKVRSRPFSIHMHWRQPKGLDGQEACYVASKNKGLMRVKPPGMLGAVGFVNLDPNDARARQMSRHNITEAGISHLIGCYAERWETDRKSEKTKVRIGEYEFSKRRCIRVETTHPNSKPGNCYCYRNVVYFDKENHLPIRTESYDWPKEGGKTDGDLLECFSFTELHLNVGLTDEVFNH